MRRNPRAHASLSRVNADVFGSPYLRCFLGGGHCLYLRQAGLQLIQRLGGTDEPHDLGMRSGGHVLGIVVQFLVEFLAGTQTRELDLDVGIRVEPAEFDQLARQVGDPSTVLAASYGLPCSITNSPCS